MLNLVYSPSYDKAINNVYTKVRQDKALKTISYLNKHKTLLQDTYTSMCNLLFWDPQDELDIFILPSWKSDYTGISNPLTVTLTKKEKNLDQLQILTNIIHELAHNAQKPIRTKKFYSKLHKKPSVATHILTFALMLETIPLNLQKYMKSDHEDYILARKIVDTKTSKEIIKIAEHFLNNNL